MEELYLALQMRLRRGERGSVSAIDAKSDPQLWLPQKEESKMIAIIIPVQPRPMVYTPVHP